MSSAACSRSHGRAAPPDAGPDEARARREAEAIADDFELAFARDRACRELTLDEGVWDGFDRECFVALLATRLEHKELFVRCVRDAVATYAACGESTPCERRPCGNAVLLDDNPVEELIDEHCRAALDPALHAQLRACR